MIITVEQVILYKCATPIKLHSINAVGYKKITYLIRNCTTHPVSLREPPLSPMCREGGQGRMIITVEQVILYKCATPIKLHCITAVGYKKITAFSSQLYNPPLSTMQRGGVDTFCRKAYLSRNTFFKLFKEQFGVTPLEYINHERIARQLLSQQQNSITQVGLQCGFTDVNYFVRLFRKAKALLPVCTNIACAEKTNLLLNFSPVTAVSFIPISGIG